MTKARETNLRIMRCLKTILYVCDFESKDTRLVAGFIQLECSAKVQRCNWNLARVDPREMQPYCIIASPFALLPPGLREKTFMNLRKYFQETPIVWLADKKETGVFVPGDSENVHVLRIDEQVLLAKKLLNKVKEVMAPPKD
jgi:hypothetical protein